MNNDIFVDRLRSHSDRLAIVTDSGVRLTYAQLAEEVDRRAAELCDPPRLIILEAANNLDCITAYLACLKAQHPVVLVEPGSTAHDGRIAQTFAASLVFRQDGSGEWRFESLASAGTVKLHPELCILLSTSGTTGSPKLVRLSRSNIESNARSIAEYLRITPDDRAITTLPPFYSFGMSVLNSHFYAGAAILLTEMSMTKDEFWHFFQQERATTFSAVPFTFDILDRRGFRTKTYPDLRYIAQAGGRFPAEQVTAYAQWGESAGTQLFVMYGQTEAAPRMAYVPPDQLLENSDCIGVPIPGGAFELLDEAGSPILEAGRPGELVYRGPNVMMGYAESAADLAGEASVNALKTGDLACRKSNGLYYIVGRKSRFSKIVGLRISLDEIERWLHRHGYSGVVAGDDKLITVATAQSNVQHAIKQAIVDHFGLPASAIHVLEVVSIPTLPSGKFDYRSILRMGQEAAGTGAQTAPRTLLAAYRETLGVEDVRPTDSFLDLGGDSVSLVEISLELEDYLGYLPEDWESMSIKSLEALRHDAIGRPLERAVSSGSASARPGFQRRFSVAVILVFGLLIAGEGAVQSWTYLTTGRGLLSLAIGNTAMLTNKETGVKTYRPNAIIKNHGGMGGRLVTNSLGLRSAEIEKTPASNELRIAVAGASTVAGAFAKFNENNFTFLLEQQLRQLAPHQPVNVVNAGVEAATLNGIGRLIDHVLIGIQPSVVVIYPGLNDIADICRAAESKKHPTAGLPAPRLPSMFITRNELAKITVGLREPPVRVGAVDPTAYFPPSYNQALDAIVTKLKLAGIEPILVTVARSFKNVDRAQWESLAATSLFYTPCLDLEGLVKASDLFNEVVTDVARRHGVDLIDLASAIPGGREYFVDAVHFTPKGEAFAAEFIYRAIIGNHVVAQRLDAQRAVLAQRPALPAGDQ